LTLTATERQAFDWVGDRYNSGKVPDLSIGCMPENREWGDEGDITFAVPEHVAWDIRDLVEEEDFAWPCFAPSLVAKLNDICWAIV
jgi:hypothetical protein